MSADIDFAALSVKDVLDLAILVEEEAEERYRELADNLEFHNTTEAAKFFRYMVTCEAGHGADLSAKRKELFGNAPVSVERSMLWGVEAPDYEVAKTFMTLQDALQVALAAEKKAFDFFDGAVSEVEDAAVRELFVALRQEEVEHMQMVRDQMKKAPDGDGFDPDDFADEGVAQ
jgi:rubrerythrin